MSTYKDLLAFKRAFALAMKIFEISKRFPKEETYSLIDQIRRSSRSICSNFAEAFRRRKYPAHFLSKLSDPDAENAETSVWLDFAFACKYISDLEYKELTADQEEVGRLIGILSKILKNICKRLLTVHCRLSTVDCRLLTAYCKLNHLSLPTPNF